MSLLAHVPNASLTSPAILGESVLTWAQMLDKVRLQNPDVRCGISQANSPELCVRLLSLLESKTVPVLAHPRWPDAQRDRAFENAGVGQSLPAPLSDIATVLFTSGSTRDPKAVAHTLDAHLQSAKASAKRTPFSRGHVWLLSLPLCHVGGLSLLFRAAVGGAALALPQADEDLAQAILRARPTHLSVVATQLRQLVNHESQSEIFRSLECVLVGGGPVSESLLNEARTLGAPVRQTYGSTEMASQVCTSDEADPFDCGLPLEGYTLSLRDEIEGVGEIVVRGPSLYRGYLQDDVLTPSGEALYTGDLGMLKNGRLSVVGRKDNLFISGGENIQPEALEAIAAEAGHRVVIVDVPDEKWGKVPVAFFGGEHPPARFSGEHFPSYAQPVAWLPLPSSALLKIRRGDLRKIAARHVEGLGR